MFEVVTPRWQSCVVAAPGPSLTPVHYPHIIAVQDAHRMLPWADVLYGCDARWWELHDGTDFKGEKWTCHSADLRSIEDDKKEIKDRYNLKLVKGISGHEFSLDQSVIHYGDNSGFQAINLAILFGCTRIILVGFDMQPRDGKTHFFGEHPQGFGKPAFDRLIKIFDNAAKKLPPHIEIINCTPKSALRCFPMMSLEDALHDKTKTRMGPTGVEATDSRCIQSAG